MGYKDDNYSTKVCGHHPETCTCRDWDTKEERERGFTITNVDKQETLEEYETRCDEYSSQLEKETVEESAERWNEKQTTLEFGKPHNAPNRIKAFIQGAKYQARKMYSEEEVINFLQEMNNWPTTFEGKIDIKDWFEQFKKK